MVSTFLLSYTGSVSSVTSLLSISSFHSSKYIYKDTSLYKCTQRLKALIGDNIRLLSNNFH